LHRTTAKLCKSDAEGTFAGTGGNDKVAPIAVTYLSGRLGPEVDPSRHLSRRVPLESLCFHATFAEHNATTSSRKSARDMFEKN
jgi:hypothetical protein